MSEGRGGILCPTCKGMVGRSWRGQDLNDALARHEQMTHGVTSKVAAPTPTKVPRKRPKA